MKIKPVIAWCGVVDDELDVVETSDHIDAYCRPYRTRKEARQRYEQVVRVEIRVVPKGREQQ